MNSERSSASEKMSSRSSYLPQRNKQMNKKYEERSA